MRGGSFLASRPGSIQPSAEDFHGDKSTRKGYARTEVLRCLEWLNTPDINPYHLQEGGAARVAAKWALLASMSPHIGLYEAALYGENAPVRNADGTAREEYLDSEKYELKPRQAKTPMDGVIAKINRVRNEHPALQIDRNKKMFWTDNRDVAFIGNIRGDDRVLTVVHTKPETTSKVKLDFPWDQMDLVGKTWQLRDAITGKVEPWTGEVELGPKRPFVFWVIEET